MTLCQKLKSLWYNKSGVNVMDYTFPVPGGKVTTGFWDLRPYSKPVDERTYIHRGWDLAKDTMRDSRIVAPEDGKVIYQYHIRCPLDKTAWINWPDGETYLFSQWYADTMGGVIVFIGDSGYTYAFGHIDVDIIFKAISALYIQYEWQRIADGYNRYINYVNTMNKPFSLSKGTVIGYIGHSGYSTGYHTHMQIHANRSYDSRIDPAELWPNRFINDNGVGPDYGPRPGADHIPARDLDLDYIRSE